MRTRPARLSFRTFFSVLLTVALPACAGSLAHKASMREQVRFGAEMAQKGNWREAIFRWERALAEDAANPRLHNNLAVAYETLGEYERAEDEYKLALKHDPHNKEIRENYALFESFYKRYRGGRAGSETAPSPAAAAKKDAAPGSTAEDSASDRDGSGG